MEEMRLKHLTHVQDVFPQIIGTNVTVVQVTDVKIHLSPNSLFIVTLHKTWRV